MGATARQEGGLVLEGTYTGKTFAALLDWAQALSHRGRRVIFWNTYNSVDLSSVMQQLDWHALPKTVWKCFDGSMALEDERLRST